MNKNDWAKIHENFTKGVFKLIRLVRVETDGKHTVLVAYNRKTGKEALERFEYIKMKCENLPTGKYQVQCKSSANLNGLTDAYELNVKEKLMLHLNKDGNIEDKTKEQTTMENISLHEYIELVQKCATLEANERVLTSEVKFYKGEMERLQVALTNKGLADGSENGGGGNGVWEVLGNTLKEVAPSLMNLSDRYINVLEKREENKSVQLSNGKVKKLPMKQKAKTIEEIAEEYADILEPLMESDPEKFNDELDLLEQEQPDVYEIVCELLGIEEEEEEEEGEQEEEEEEEEGGQ
jgi:hypothetical protein